MIWRVLGIEIETKATADVGVRVAVGVTKPLGVSVGVDVPIGASDEVDATAGVAVLGAKMMEMSNASNDNSFSLRKLSLQPPDTELALMAFSVRSSTASREGRNGHHVAGKGRRIDLTHPGLARPEVEAGAL